MKIYIASSWKNQHAVEMLTDCLETRGHEVISFVREAFEAETPENIRFDFEEWIWSEEGRRKFHFDLNGATKSDLVVYIGPSGTDAWAELGAAWATSMATGKPLIFGLYAKGEPSGLMRRMVTWHLRYSELLKSIDLLCELSCKPISHSSPQFPETGEDGAIPGIDLPKEV